MYELLIHGYHMEVAQTDDLMPLCERTNKLSGYREAGIAPLADQKEKCFSTVVLGYARLNEDQIREGIRRLAAAWKCSRPCP